MRQQFNVGQEIISQDLNSLQSRLERGIYDRLLYEMMGRKTNAFFKDSFRILYQSATSFVVKAGVGFQTIVTDSKEPDRKPLVRDADVTLNIDTPDSSNPRIDILVVRHGRFNTLTESRKFKDEFTNLISNQNFTIATDWQAEIQYLAGTPAGSPVAPVTPAGWIKVAELYVSTSTGIANQAAITDSRVLLPIMVATNETGSSDYDAIVGLVGVDQGVTHATLKGALDNAQDGWKILVLRSEAPAAIPVVLNNNIEIVFKRGVTISKDTTITGLQVDGDDCKIVGGRFSGFGVSGDSGILVSASAARTVIDTPRFLGCDSNVIDNGQDTYANVLFTE
jgi:hypothetical protein